MEADLHDTQLDWIAGFPNSALPAALEWDLAGAPGYTLERFARAVGQVLVRDGICIRLNESRDGSRILTAWRAQTPDSWHVIPVDFIRVSVDEVDTIAGSIKRNLDLALTD
jgi:hypothetical protein